MLRMARSAPRSSRVAGTWRNGSLKPIHSGSPPRIRRCRVAGTNSYHPRKLDDTFRISRPPAFIHHPTSWTDIDGQTSTTGVAVQDPIHQRSIVHFPVAAGPDFVGFPARSLGERGIGER